jgi:hypothetical protein
LSSHVACESLDDSTCAKALHSPPIASPKLVCLGDVQGNFHGKGASCNFRTEVPKPTYPGADLETPSGGLISKGLLGLAAGGAILG